ncbi:MAG: hypothetical protein IKJ65_03920 [Clostridia bacterium]|nr:hypothetical protein [Clostridia bacterium]
MTLPGKVSVCFLEEDVPQKAYFRIKPLFVKGDGSFERIENTKELLPDEGGIRIVPDKNESSRFKARMRTLGSFCLLDLTRHPNENDKIRPNKNYNPANQENNKNIVYSDVIDRCPAEWLMEVIRVDAVLDHCASAFLKRKPGTDAVALIAEGVLSFPYVYQEDENGKFTFTPDETCELRATDEKAYMRLFKEKMSEDAEIEFILTAAGQPLYKRIEKAEEAADEQPAQENAPESEAQAEQPAEVKQAEPENTEPAPACEKPIEEAAPKEAEAEKKWVKPASNERIVPLRIREKESAQVGQTGLNPRKGRSLAEVVDDGWRKSRMDQFGAPIPVDVTGMPVVSPVEHASELLKKAWDLKEARNLILTEILKLEDFAENAAPHIADCLAAPVSEAESNKLNSLIAEKLKILSEIDELRIHKAAKREALMDELRQVHKAEFAKYEQNIRRLKAEREKALKDAENARAACESAKRLMEKGLSESIKTDFEKLYEALKASTGDVYVSTEDYERSPSVYAPSGAQLISDIRNRFEKSGRAFENDEAVNLLACLYLGRFLLVSGKTGAGKTAFVTDLAEAMGLTQKGARRFLSLVGGSLPAPQTSAFKALTAFEDMQSLRILLMDDANGTEAVDQSRGLISWMDQSKSSSALRIVMTVLDDQVGYPVNPRILDRAFFMRIPSRDVAHLSGVLKTVESADVTVSLDALSEIFKTDRPLPAQIEDRLNAFIEATNAIGVPLSERTITDISKYISAVLPYMTCSPMEVLDYALSQRAVPYLLATARVEALNELPEILCDMKKSLQLMNEPLALPPLE